MSLLGGSVLGEDEIQPTQRHELLQSSVVSMYSLPDVTRSAGRSPLTETVLDYENCSVFGLVIV